MDYSEKLVVKGLKEGDTEAYQYIFDTHYQVLCHTANRYVRDGFVVTRSMSTLRCAATYSRQCATDVLTIYAPSTSVMRWLPRNWRRATVLLILPMASSRSTNSWAPNLPTV